MHTSTRTAFVAIAAAAALLTGSEAGATTSLVLFTDPNESAQPIAVEFFDQAPVGIVPCPPPMALCTWFVGSIEGTPSHEKAAARLGADGPDFLTWTERLAGSPELIEKYTGGLDFYLVDPDGTTREIVNILLTSDDFLLLTYFNAPNGEDFGKVPDDAFRFGRDYPFTALNLMTSERGLPKLSFGNTLDGVIIGSESQAYLVIAGVPEPTSLALLGLALAGLGFSRRRKLH